MSSLTGGPKGFFRVMILLTALILLTASISILFVGRLPLTLNDWLTMSPLARIALSLRVPRVVFSLIAGASLAAAGAALQAVFRNPLASPSILGVSQGAAFGAAVGILMFTGIAALIEASAFVSGLAAVMFTYFLARMVRYGGSILRLILAGMASAALFNAGVGVVKSLADPLKQLPEITFWLLGSFAGLTEYEVVTAGSVALVGAVAVGILSWRLNILSLGDEQAKALGVNPKIYRNAAIFASITVVSAVTAVAGQIMWIGLVMPHLGRKVVGSDNRRAVPAAALIGALIMLIADDIARGVSAAEIPLSVVTSLIGVPIFVAILSMRESRK